MRIEQWGSLRAYVTGGTDGRGGGDGPVVVLMHGFGASGDDLVGIGRALEVGANVRFVFPEAPIAFDLGLGFGESRAWWMIDLVHRQEMLLSGRVKELVRETPEGLEEARAAVIELLDHMSRALSPSRLVLGGFSQGAMVATDVALHTDRALAGLILYSGTLLAEEEWMKRAPARKHLPVLQSHGTRDPLLPIQIARRLAESLKAAGLELELLEFPGEHEIPMFVLQKTSAFLARILNTPGG